MENIIIVPGAKNYQIINKFQKAKMPKALQSFYQVIQSTLEILN